jgi:hypothetical protein
LGEQLRIHFAFLSFKWANLAAHNAAVTVVIVGLSYKSAANAALFDDAGEAGIKRRDVANINAYLVAHGDLVVEARSAALSEIQAMTYGNKPADGGHLILTPDDARSLVQRDRHVAPFVRPYVGAHDAIQGGSRYCIWVTAEYAGQALSIEPIKERVDRVAAIPSQSKKALTSAGANTAYAFQQVRQSGEECVLSIPSHSSESRSHLPILLYPKGVIVSNAAFVLFDAALWTLALIASRLHLVWIGTVCGKLETRYRYSNTLGWNTFPVPLLTEQNKADLTACAENSLLAREAHFPATIADLYDPDAMPDNLRQAHERNDEVLERIYIGRRFKNETERLEKLFELYTKMTADAAKSSAPTKKGKKP